MNLTVQKPRPQAQDVSPGRGSASGRYVGLRTCLSCWEAYLIVLLAAFLRLYLINTTEFDDDQAAIFRMAHDAVSHGHLVATSNIASVGNFNPPGIIYILMLPALFSANPVWGAVLTALLATLAVGLTYFFTRRYYGRLAGTVAALTYATASLPVFYSRFMWQQNLLLFFVPLYIALLFWGVVERRRGWLAPALLLLGLLFQLHGSGLLLAAPLLVALLLVPHTVRWRDLALGWVFLCIIYLPYILWEISTNFNDIALLYAATKRPALLDTQALFYYELFLNPFNQLTGNARSLLAPFTLLFTWLGAIVTGLVIVAAVMALVLVIRPRTAFIRAAGRRKSVSALWHTGKLWWNALRASPYRCGLCLLLVWQIVPLAGLVRHSINLHPHYLIMFMPGPFILLGLLSTWVASWLQRRGGRWMIGRLALFCLLGMLVLAQVVGSAGAVIDLAYGNFFDRQLTHPYYNDLSSLQQAVITADRLAQQRKVHHVYINADQATLAAFRYLSAQMRTPTVIFNDACVMLPAPAEGPVVLLVGPYSDYTDALLARYASATLVATSARLGGPPFRLYIVQASTRIPSVRETLSHNVQLLGAQSFTYRGQTSLVTRWRLLHTLPPANDTLYTYALFNGQGKTSWSQGGRVHRTTRFPDPTYETQCAFTSTQAGDQLLVSLHPPINTPLDVKVQFYTTTRYDISLKLFGQLAIPFETYETFESPWQTLRTTTGKDTISLSPP